MRDQNPSPHPGAALLPTPPPSTGMLVVNLYSGPIGATIRILNNQGGEVHRASTTRRGVIEMPLEPGLYHVVVAINGFKESRQAVPVIAGGVSSVNPPSMLNGS